MRGERSGDVLGRRDNSGTLVFLKHEQVFIAGYQQVSGGEQGALQKHVVVRVAAGLDGSVQLDAEGAGKYGFKGAAHSFRLPAELRREDTVQLILNFGADRDRVLAHGLLDGARRGAALLGKLQAGDPDVRVQYDDQMREAFSERTS